ncbi:MAG: amidohydrolase [Acidobacteriia bacterium]|nr:amidohydrolase [Terriglobia bacterium]
MSKPESTPLDRRDFLKTAGGAAAALAAGSSLAGLDAVAAQPPAVDASGAPDKLRIDIHGHIYPEKYLDMLDSMGGGGTGTHIARIAKGSGNPDELEARFQMMDRAGVKIQVLSPAPQLPYFEKKELAVKACRFINDAYAEHVRRHPDRFVAYVTTPLPHVDAALEEMARGLDTLGMVGVTMGTSVLTRSVADPMFDPFWEEMNRRGTILFFHPHGLGACSSLVQQYDLTWPIGAEVEDTMVVGHLLAKQIPKRYPRVRIIVPHLGGDISLLMNRINNQKMLFLPADAEKPSVTVKRLWYDTVSHAYAPALRVACEALGYDRFLLGSDYPYETGEIFQQCVDYVKDPGVGLTPDQAEAILDRNAQALFRLVPKAPAAK